MLWVVPFALTALLEGPAARTEVAASPDVPPVGVSATDLLTRKDRRVRAMTPRLADAMADGARRSRTFADLVMRLQRTNVIVYVESRFALPPDTSGRLLLSTVAGNQRYLRVQVQGMLPWDQMIAVIAHELQHALEVAAEPAVVDQAGLAALYTRIGDRGRGRPMFDTDAARAAGQRVRDELMG